MAMIVTGRTLDEMRGEEYDVAREQVLSYLTGRVGSTLGRSLQRATGLDVVRIEPQLIANEADPGARLTLGQDLTDDLTLTYSVNLTDSDDQIWLATYDVTKRFQTRAVRESDNSYRVRLPSRHPQRRRARAAPQTARQADGAVDHGARRRADSRRRAAQDARRERRARSSTTSPSATAPKTSRSACARPDGLSRASGSIASRTQAGVKLNLRIVRGPQVEFAYAGMTPPRKIQERSAPAMASRCVRRAADRRCGGNAAGVVDARRLPAGEGAVSRRRQQSRAAGGPVRHQRRARGRAPCCWCSTAPPGSRAGELDSVIDEQKLERQLFSDPIVVTELLQRLYREQGYLNIEIDKPRYEFEGAVARVVLDIREGAQFTVQDVTMSGNSAITTPSLLLNLPVVPGEPYMPTAAENASAVHPRPLLGQGLQRRARRLPVDGRSHRRPDRRGLHHQRRTPGGGVGDPHCGQRQDQRTPGPRTDHRQAGRAAQPAGAQPLAQESLRQRRVLDRRSVARHHQRHQPERTRWSAR